MVYAYRDSRGWGVRLARAGRQRGLAVHLFSQADAVPDRPVPVFVHMNHHPDLRAGDKQLMARLAERRVLLIPTALEAELYDDKVRQYRLLHRYMPPSWHLVTREQARAVLPTMPYSFVSKAATGAASSNVRLVRTPAEAEREIALAFGPGIPLHWAQRQRGYLFWQRFCPDNAHDWRVTIIAGRYAFVVRRLNREAVPFASGGTRFEPVEAIDSPFVVNLLNQALQVVLAYGFLLCAMDFVLDRGALRLLETSVGWPFQKFASARFFVWQGGAWRPTPYREAHLFELLVHAIGAGEFT